MPTPMPFLVLPLLLAALGPAASQAQVATRDGAFLRSERETASADIAIDAAGVPHMGFVHWEPEAEGAEALYATCAGPVEACGDEGAWTAVEVLPAATRVQVAVTADGRPRLLIEGSSTTQPGGVDYSYAECDAGCTDRASWTVTLIATSWDNSMSAIMSGERPHRTFLLDPEGRPQFLYSDRNYLIEPDHYGTFWMSCKGACTDRANWTETDLARHSGYDTEIFDDPSLAVDPQGRPRVAGRIFAFGENGEDAPEGLYYLACDSGCTRSANWKRVWVIDAGSGSYPSPTWSLAIDPRGRPRIAFFAGDGMEQAELSHTLIYMWCDAADCLASDEAWNGTIVATDAHGEAAGLALTAEGHPRLALLTAGAELAYAWCDESCETPEGAWDATMVEGQGELSTERPTALPFTCDGELWNGVSPQIALTAEGRPVVAYDVSVQGRCLYHEDGKPETDVTYEFHEIWRGARVVTFAP